FKKHADAWVAGLPSLGALGWKDVSKFRRGMLEHVTLPYDGEPGPLFAALDVRGVKQNFREGRELRPFLQQPWLSRLASLDLSFYAGHEGVTEAAVRLLGSSPALSNLAHLGLEGSCLGPRLIRARLGALPDAALSSLDLTSNNSGVEGARALAGSPALGGLRVLRLGGNQIGLEGAEALAASPAVAGLAVL